MEEMATSASDAPTRPARGEGKRRRKKSEEAQSGGNSATPKSAKRKSGNTGKAGDKPKKSRGTQANGSSRKGPKPLHGPSLFDALTRKNVVIGWVGALLLLVALLIYPVADGATRSLTLILIAALAVGLLGLWWRYPLLRWLLLGAYLLLISYWFLPGRTSFDRPALREETARALRLYEGTSVWTDGENRLGIDGAGLARRGIIEATFSHGMRTLNPWLLRRSFAFWWEDLSAAELLPNAKGSARRYTVAKSLSELNPAVLYPGDFVVTQDRQHVLAYLGDGRWLWPDPEQQRVVVIRGDSTAASIAGMPVSLMRWRILEAPRAHSMYLP